jgi:hypothetical protein
VAEAIRLRVHSIDLRITSRAIELTDSKGGKSLSLPSGRLLAVCPFESHHDDALYPPRAWDFDPERKPLTLGDGSAVVPSVAGEGRPPPLPPPCLPQTTTHTHRQVDEVAGLPLSRPSPAALAPARHYRCRCVTSTNTRIRPPQNWILHGFCRHRKLSGPPFISTR